MLPGTAAIPAPYRDRQEAAYLSGKRIVEMVRENLRPSEILTRAAFENCIAVCSAIGGSTNAPVHINAIARHIGVKLDNDDWEKIGYELTLLVNLQPAGEYLGEEYYRAGGLPAVVAERVKQGKIKDAITVNGKTLAQNCEGRFSSDRKVIWPYDKPMKKKAGFLNLKGNLFDSAIIKTSVITPEFRQRYLENRPTRWPSRARPLSSTAPRTTTRASMTRRPRPRRTACSSFAVSVRWATPARPRW